jgi:pilus assembly protein Flp/PilA
MKQFLMRFWKDDEGPTAVEYGLMLFMITVAVVAAVGPLRDAVIGAFNAATAAFTGGGGGGS